MGSFCNVAPVALAASESDSIGEAVFLSGRDMVSSPCRLSTEKGCDCDCSGARVHGGTSDMALPHPGNHRSAAGVDDRDRTRRISQPGGDE